MMIKIDNALTDELIAKSLTTARGRINYNFHEESEIINRFLNILQPKTYCQPHKHQTPDKFEIFLIFSGKAAIFEFTDDGSVSDIFILDSNTGNYGVEIAPGVWHTIVCLAENTICYEIKEGPYDPSAAKHFANFAPAEGSAESVRYLEKLKELARNSANKQIS